MRTCNTCNKEKDLESFRKLSVWRAHICKACYSAKSRTGKQNPARFIKGQVPWIKGKKGMLTRRETPKYVKKGRPILNIPARRAQWAIDVRTRDGFVCQICSSVNDLSAHHIVPWKQDESKRFDLDNGVTLCRSCHSRTERLLESANRVAIRRQA